MLRFMVVALLMVAGSEGMRMAKAPMVEMRLGGGMRGAMHSTPLTRRHEDMLLLNKPPALAPGCPGSIRLRGGAARGPSMSLSLPEYAKMGSLVYGIIVGAGGLVAGIRSGSKPSIISGVISSILLIFAYMQDNMKLALATSSALCLVFGIRFYKTRKAMPAGVLGTASLLFSLLFGMGIKW
ncbi:hypothetical protein GUITHDRAFT_151112 [Guillardia theta CCMP2712]|uniref:Transmembrane protein 14C n=1 Tax=Guillardia theta (strain CCMP2712) TaxID=905079 RepID=L1JRJ9_GUITC|nr:hypothetical protein GUITHDRAFT_151112 [Guillardia theta CCMP2712]EKX50914.1 hypothetical protein GUITHDRAFT_151112 [Guillardia theta CCMP2712]|eukprot:XP_005837894.1 hypothetical protein GUITHDRAFT_151112 [Guillardia theta CCMP2712]